MFFKGKVDTSEVVKWGILSGFLEGAYIGIVAILYSQASQLAFVSTGFESVATMLLLLLITISGIVTTVIVFAHPLYSALQKRYQEALMTVAVTLVTLLAIYGFTTFTYRQLFG